MSMLSRLKVPVFTAGGMPKIDPGAYSLSVRGLTDAPDRFSLEEIKTWTATTVNARLTSVSGWSVRADWHGVLWRDFLPIARPLPQATHVTFVSLGEGYETTVSLSDLDHPRVVMAWAVGQEPLEPEYGGPLRMIIPNLYGYKSAKWLTRIEFVDSMQGGFWEDRGYSESGTIEPGVTLDCNTGQQRPISGGEVLDF